MSAAIPIFKKMDKFPQKRYNYTKFENIQFSRSKHDKRLNTSNFNNPRFNKSKYTNPKNEESIDTNFKNGEYTNSNNEEIKSDSRIYNPQLIIDPIVFNQKTYHVVRDDYLCGGTKQRGLVPLMENSPATEFVYAGPTTGYAQVALAYAAKLTGKKATIIINKETIIHPFTNKAYNYGAHIIRINNGHLRKIQQKAQNYVNERPYSELIPFGGNSEKFIEYMYDSIMDALPQELIENNPKRMWLVCGSSTLLQVLYRVFPRTEFIIIQIGKKIWDDQLQLYRTTKYVANERFQEKAFVMPPYPSVATYDAKLWIYASQHAKDGDYIWNVACD